MGGTPISGYNVYRGTSPDGEGAILVASGVQTPFTDTYQLEDSTTYYYQVSAVNLVGSGPKSSAAAATTLHVPSPPRNLTAVAGDCTVDLTWDPAVSNDGSALIYRIYRSTSTGMETFWAAATTTSYQDVDLTNGQTYYYIVKAVNATGEGAASNEVSALPCTIPSAPLNLTAEAGDGRVSVSWNLPMDDGGSAITGYRLYWSNSSEGEFKVMVLSDTALNHDGLVNGLHYYYKVAAVNAVGEGLPTDVVIATPLAKPAPPYDLKATGGDQKVDLTWSAPLDSVNSNILGYRIYRGNSSLEMRLYDTSLTTNYTDNQVVNGQTYYYRVSAVNATGESRLSNEVSATPAVPSLDLVSEVGRYWIEILVLLVAVMVVVGAVFLMVGSGMLSLGKEGMG